MFKKVWAHLTRSKNPNSRRYRWDMARRICGHHIRYVTERREEVEEVIGKSGGLNIKDGDLLVFASARVLMRVPVEELQAAELLSGDGVVLTGPDLEHGGEVRTITVYYVYYR